MDFRFCKYGRAGAVLLGLLGAACHRPPMLSAPVAAPLPPVAAVESGPPVTLGVSEVLAQARRATISGVAYELDFRLHPGKTDSIAVKEKVMFKLKDARTPVQLDFKAPASYLHRLRVNGQPVPIDHRAEHLVLPATALHPGRNEVEIDLRAGELSLNRNADYLYTLLVPDRARTVLPVFDQPDLKATFKLALTVPRLWQAVANAPLVDSTAASLDGRVPGFKTYNFATSDSISTYLFSFAAGKFSRLNRTVKPTRPSCA
jgi:aminopeptidase N